MDEQLYKIAVSMPLEEKITKAIATIQHYADHAAERDWFSDAIYGCDSGGKDSCVIMKLAEWAGVKVEWHHNLTTTDAPETVRFIRKHHPQTTIHRPKRNFFSQLADNGLPTRRNRWCCRLFKERGGDGLVMLMGLRCEEGSRRKSRVRIYGSWRDGAMALCPLAYWTDADVWEFIRRYDVPYCELYDEPDIDRIGCVLCPMGRKHRKKQAARWPRIARAWKKAAGIYFRSHSNKTTRTLKTEDAYWEWWLSDEGLGDEQEECQMGMF